MRILLNSVIFWAFVIAGVGAYFLQVATSPC